MTRWYGEPGTAKSTMVHFVNRERHDFRWRLLPICGARIGKHMEFQHVANGHDQRYVECPESLRLSGYSKAKGNGMRTDPQDAQEPR